LPNGYETAGSADAIEHAPDASTLRKLFAEAGVQVHQVELPSGRFPVVVQKSNDWIAPTLFVSSMLMSQNPYATQIALGVIASYISEHLQGFRPGQSVELSFIVETSKSRTCKKLTYQGPVSGIKDLPQIFRELDSE
jgi:hypothetical protein